MDSPQSWMAREIAETPDVVARQASALAAPLTALVDRLSRRPPSFVVTCARGSSAHAATFGKHLLERYLGLPVAAAAPSIASVYRRSLRLENQLVLSISQSGTSDDLVAFAKKARASGAVTAAVTNYPGAALAAACDFVLPIEAGVERSVAATKTFVATVAALLRLIRAWGNVSDLEPALERLPDRLAASAGLDWSGAADALVQARSTLAIGRGPTLAIAREAALKLKETCNVHAEAFSGAELLHGPVALVSARYPVLMFMPTDAASDGMRELARLLTARGSMVFITGVNREGRHHLPSIAPDQPETDALCLIQSFYTMLPGLAGRFGTDVDNPRNLRKITRTT